ncbi:hypothetical protein SS50377_22163 [Spironucleus salmonicida]|nr:hypothetical protein SS50377_22163 [Spironucleus salmonicida]
METDLFNAPSFCSFTNRYIKFNDKQYISSQLLAQNPGIVVRLISEKFASNRNFDQNFLIIGYLQLYQPVTRSLFQRFIDEIQNFDRLVDQLTFQICTDNNVLPTQLKSTLFRKNENIRVIQYVQAICNMIRNNSQTELPRILSELIK